MNKIVLKSYKVIPIILCLGLFILVSCAESKKIKGPAQKTNSNLEFKDYFHQANSEKLIGNFDNALELFQKCITIKPSSSASYFAVSQIYTSQKNTDKAIEFGKRAYEIDESNKWYSHHLAELYFSIGDYFNSAKFYEKVVEEFEDKNLDTKSKLTESYIYSNQKEKAIYQLNRIEIEAGKSVIGCVTKHDLLKELGKNELANEEIVALFEEYKNNIEIPIETMDYFLQTRQTEAAKMAIDQILKIDENNGNAWVGLAEMELANDNIEQTFIYLEKGLRSSDIDSERKVMLLESLTQLGFEIRYPKSLEINKRMYGLFKMTFDEESNNSKYLNLFGQYLIHNEKEDSARIMHSKVAEIAPSNFQNWVNLLDADYISEQYDNLVKDGNQALELFPSQPIIYLLTGIGYYETEVYDRAEEMFFLGKGLVISDEELKEEFNYQVAKNLWKQGSETESKEAFDKLFEVIANNDKYYFGFASLLSESNQQKKAKTFVKKAIELDSRNPEYFYFYGKILFEEKDYSAAEEILDKAVTLDLSNALYIELLGDATFLNGNASKAIEIWEEAYKIKPENQLKQKIETKSYHE